MLIGLEMYQEAYQYLNQSFETTLQKAASIDIYVLEAELELKLNEDHKKALNILKKVLDEDKLHPRALLLTAHILIMYDGKYQEGLDLLLRCKMLRYNKSHELWNLLGHAYGLIDGVWDKSEEWFAQAAVVQLERPEWYEMLELVPYNV